MSNILLPYGDFLTEDELAFFGAMGGFDVKVTDGENPPHGEAPDHEVPTSELYESELPPDPETRTLAHRLVTTLIIEGDDAFNDLYLANETLLLRESQFSYVLSRIIVVGFKVGISHENAFCANTLGTLYYEGDIVEQDYERARQLYELAMEWGCHQSIINLGYIYEYGRTGEPDHLKAYQYYALAAALAPTSEALYKLGDMYSRGKAVARNLRLARTLWQRSYEVALKDDDPEGIAQPAIRLAKLYLKENAPEAGTQPDALKALELYQKAEIGLRISVSKGMDYYRKRLQEAIDGQALAREQLTDDSWRIA